MQNLDVIKSLIIRLCTVPLNPPLQTASGDIEAAPLVLIDLETISGIRGSAYLFTYTSLAQKPVADLIKGMAEWIIGQRLAPVAIHDLLSSRMRLLGAQGLVLMAIGGIDMAVWDALAKSRNQPLAIVLGGEMKKIPTYATMRNRRPDDLKREADELLRLGFEAFKIRIGLPELKDDINAIMALRAVIGRDARLMVDYNQSLTVVEAKRRIAELDKLTLGWIEEPTLANDFSGQADICRAAITPIQAGENWWGPEDAAKSLAAGATDLMMPDIMKIGGVTGWQRAIALADSVAMPVSSHIFPEISAHCLAATPNAHYLEYLDFAGILLKKPLQIRGGVAIISDEPGNGLDWNEAAIARFQVS